jgi:hypothetical protein
MTVDQDGGAANELVITVYLDTNALLDLLATVEDGFTLVERVTSGQATGSTLERSGEIGFGTPGVFNFFKLGLSGKLATVSRRIMRGMKQPSPRSPTLTDLCFTGCADTLSKKTS